MGTKDATSYVKISPPEVLTLKPNGIVELSMENSGKKQVAFKLKTTRPKSVKPEKSFGVIPKNGKTTVKFQFKPAANEKPFLSEDRITILLCPMPEKFSSAEKFWKSPSSDDAKRVVRKLEKAGEKAKKKAVAKEEPPEEEPVSEESEAEETENTADEA